MVVPQSVTQQHLPSSEKLKLSSSSQHAMRTSTDSFLSVSPRSRASTSIDLRSLPLASKLCCLPAALAARFEPSTLAVAQVWTCCSNWSSITKAQPGTLVMRTQPMGAHLSDPHLAPFRTFCCQSGIQRSAVGMLGKVWSSGSLAVVQNLAIIPTSVHPRNKLPDHLLGLISELAYIPVYDLRQPNLGVVACLEVLLSSVAVEETIANVISNTCDLLTQFQLSLCKPPTRPPVPTALPSPFQAMLPPPSRRHCSPCHSIQPAVVPPAAASAMAAAVLSSPRQTSQQQCYAALLDQELQWHRQQSKCGYATHKQSSSDNGYAGDSHSYPTQFQQPSTWMSVSRNSTCSSQSGFSMNSGTCSPRSPQSAASTVQAPLSMSRTTSIRHLDVLSDVMQYNL